MLRTDEFQVVTSTYFYEAYGKPKGTVPTEQNPFRYGGKFGYYTDSEIQTLQVGARWYSPNLIRWMSRDPIHYRGGDNLSEYVMGNPVKYVDPSGLDLLNTAANVSAGFGDYLTWGGTKWVRGQWDKYIWKTEDEGNGGVAPNSLSYRVGEWAGVTWDCLSVASSLASMKGYSVVFRRYPNAGGGGGSLLRASTSKSSPVISVDWHRFGSPTKFRPHIDIPSKGINHWPW